MRKEFEENEESKKTLENNLEIQDEIDDETFQKILEEEFIERERQIEEALSLRTKTSRILNLRTKKCRILIRN